jgi:hypothetical protein
MLRLRLALEAKQSAVHMNLKTIIEGNDTTAGRVFDLTIQLLIVVSVITFSIETIPNLSDSTTQLLSITETFVVSIFTLEYLMRVYVADKKRDYIFSFYGIVMWQGFSGQKITRHPGGLAHTP